MEKYEKLSRGENGYGGRCASPGPEVGEGLLARKLRRLGVRRDERGEGGEEVGGARFEV